MDDTLWPALYSAFHEQIKVENYHIEVGFYGVAGWRAHEYALSITRSGVGLSTRRLALRWPLWPQGSVDKEFAHFGPL